MWVDPGRRDALGNIRHQAMLGDGLKKFGWVAHDGETFGRQELYDEQYKIKTEFVKRLEAGDGEGGSLGIRFSAEMDAAAAAAAAEKKKVEVEDDGGEEGEEKHDTDAISFFFYVAAEDGGNINLHALDVVHAVNDALQGKKEVNAAALSGTTAPFGPWHMHMRMHKCKDVVGSANFFAASTPHTHNLTAMVYQSLAHSLYKQAETTKDKPPALVLPDLAEPTNNVVIIQITAKLPLTVDVVFTSGQGRGKNVNDLSGPGLTARLNDAEKAFDDKFDQVLGQATGGAPGGKKVPRGTREVARAALSNMLGGMGYWYGRSLVKTTGKEPWLSQYYQQHSSDQNDNGEGLRPVELWDTPLFSATPSRSFFPRGFLWDEGFHQLLIRRWNPSISRDALAHWLDLMTVDGWIPREQILGLESRLRVPEEFIPQSPDAANPPALFLVFSEMAERVVTAVRRGRSEDEEAKKDLEFLRAAWPRLRTWVKWYNSTQSGPVEGSFRWRGRDATTTHELNPKTLTSGLDDYPRASHPSNIERHLDLRCWMTLAVDALASVGSAVGAPAEEVAELRTFASKLDDYETLKRLHYDPANKMFADWGLHSEATEMGPVVNDKGEATGDFYRMVKIPPTPQFVPQYGYVSLFPLAFNLIPVKAKELGTELEKLIDQRELWSIYGLRSLSFESRLYNKFNTKTDPPYWRGHVWININYLVLRALRRYAREAGSGAVGTAAGRAAEALRTNLLDTIVKGYHEQGYLFETYDDLTGEGHGTHPFTGWTALMTLIAAE